jgi:S1-C subfamily serine protease
MKTLRPIFIFCSIIIIIALACTLPGGTKVSPTKVPVEKATPVSDTSPTTPPNKSGGVGSLSDAQNAVIQIESQGTFVDPQVGLVVNGAGRGSGFIIDPSGIAVTNNHVVTGSALLKVWVNGVQHNAQILGVSECSDLAVIKVEGGPYPYLNWYEDGVKTGLEVYAAGFPLGEPQYSLTKGIISKEKADGQTSWASLDYVLGHDATINPGNSGGPLITGDGQVVGINYSTLKSANQYFAIDAKTAQPVVEQLMKGKDIDAIGINGTAVRSDDGKLSGIWVASVKSGSPADKSGVKPGDILYQMENLVLATDGTMKDYCDIIRTHKPNDTLSLKIIRFAAGELLEGQLNGRELSVTGKFDVGGTNNNNDNNNNANTGGSQDYFKDEFEGDISNYTYFEWHELGTTKTDNSVIPTTKDGYLVFNLTKANKWVYVTYNPYKYTDVRLDVKADNRGKNTNNVSLICRYSDEGWYEFNIANNGLYWIYAYIRSDGSYNRLYNGGSNLIKQGKDVNEYTLICNGDDITVGVNGVEVKTITDTKYRLRDGKVGLGVSSFNVLPILVNIDYFQVSQP